MYALLLMTALLGDTPEAATSDTAQYKPVVTRALAFLDGAGAELEKGEACITCHHAPLRNWALKEASALGVEVDLQKLKETNAAQLQTLLQTRADYRGKPWGHSLLTLYLLSGMKDLAEPAQKATFDDLIPLILIEQTNEGTWKAATQAANQRRPKRDADEAQTMWSILALSKLGPHAEATAARERAQAWLAAAEPGATIDSRALRIVVEQQLGSTEKAAALAAKLVETQHPDGGWGWQPDDPSEAWPVGMALYALSSLGDKVPAESIHKAQAFLAKTQLEDGSWLVQAKLRDNARIASYFGTAWAIIGLARTLPAEKR